ncbi:hypothetical protein N9R48_00415 [Rickettsiales bacterium]|jgi:hypothetical protein|nr:hypothetical protein [Rickettsiales bacterium]
MSKPVLTYNKNPGGHHSLAKGGILFLLSSLVAAIAIIGCAVVNSVAAGAKLAGKKRIGAKIDKGLLKQGPIALFVNYMHFALNNLNNPKSDGRAPPTYFIERQEEKETADVTGSTQLPNPPPESGVPDSSTSPCEVTGLRKRRHTCSRS